MPSQIVFAERAPIAVFELDYLNVAEAVVAPDADARILLTADERARMARRGLQNGGVEDAEQSVVLLSNNGALPLAVSGPTAPSPNG